MSSLTITTTYADAAVLTEAHIDEIKNGLESFYNAANIEESNIQDNSLNAASALSNNSITSDKILNGTIVTNSLADSAVTTQKLSTDSVTTNKLASNAITTAKFENNFTPGAALYDNGFDKIKLPAIQIATSSVSFTQITSTNSALPTTLNSVTISNLIANKPVLITLIPDYQLGAGGEVTNRLTVSRASGVTEQSGAGYYKILRDGTDLSGYDTIGTNWSGDGFSGFLAIPPNALFFIDLAPTSANHTYTLVGYKNSSNMSSGIQASKLQATQVV